MVRYNLIPSIESLGFWMKNQVCENIIYIFGNFLYCSLYIYPGNPFVSNFFERVPDKIFFSE